MIAVVDYGAGNLRSVVRALEYAGVSAEVTSDADRLAGAAGMVLPGVGAAAATMQGLRERGLVGPVRQFIDSGRPFLGVCMGFQTLLTFSEEGGHQECLDIIPGAVRKLPTGLKVPQMGWNNVTWQRDHPLLRDIPDGSYFYFVHSFYAEPEADETVIATVEYGRRFPAILAQGNVFATQFHPEKSGARGLQIYRNFAAQCS
ncbi:MAG TPA: imidazole glycerol phosphate synthase subunit HisH [Chloroflexota bacterium]|nr:imidazole glycerol phosphate synthase subunit HisH [Chloroflexota bacterium]